MKINIVNILKLLNGNYFQFVNQGDGLCDGFFLSFIEVGFKVIFQKFLYYDMDIVVIMLINMVG